MENTATNTYDALSTQVALDSTVSAMVLLNPDNSEIEFWPVAPALTDEAKFAPVEGFSARKLRSVGVVGLCGPEARCAFKEPLEASMVTAIHASFFDYLRALFGTSFGELSRDAEIHELDRLMSLPDVRTINRSPKSIPVDLHRK